MYTKKSIQLDEIRTRKPEHRARRRRQRRTLGSIVRQVQAFLLRNVPIQEELYG